jgi:hypothetical protein
MKRVLKRLKETRTGASPIPVGTMVVFAQNEEAWRGRVSEVGALRNGEPLYYIKNAVSAIGNGVFDVEGREIIKDITDLEIEHGYGFMTTVLFRKVYPFLYVVESIESLFLEVKMMKYTVMLCWVDRPEAAEIKAENKTIISLSCLLTIMKNLGL